MSNQQPTGGNMLDGGELSLESGFDYKEIRKLIELGHKVIFDLGSFGGYQAIMYDDKMGVYFGASLSVFAYPFLLAYFNKICFFT